MTDLVRDWCNGARYVPHDRAGHYESWFQRANHPTRPLAWWIRYTLTSPKGHPEATNAALWAVYFDGERDHVISVKQVERWADCQFAPEHLDVRIGAASLTQSALSGVAASGGHEIRWVLEYAGSDPPLLLLPRAHYNRSFPRAKALVGTPRARFEGHLVVDGEEITIDGWPGSQNHNWGRRHTDTYAWGQVCGFDDSPDAFLECATARLRIGPIRTPPLTVMVLRVDRQQYALNTPSMALRAKAQVAGFDWSFDSQSRVARIRGRIHAAASRFVALSYENPPGGHKTCLNSKLAACELVLERPDHPPRRLVSQSRAAFEILTDDPPHGIAFAV